MSSKPVAAWKPEWNIQLQEVRETAAAMDYDSLINTHPIHQQAETPEQIVELADAITYLKTAAVLRMLEAYLGPDTFRAGVNAYLTKHAYANATAADFWNAQTQASGKPVDTLMPAFVNQPGPPLVTLQTACSGNSEKVTLTQRRYFYDRARFEAGSNERWQIPVCMRPGSTNAPEHCEIFSQPQQTFTLSGCSSWINLNADAKGYYLSGYDSASLQAMAKDAETALSPQERILLPFDVWASVRVGRQPIGDYLTLVEGLQGDRNPAVVGPLLTQLGLIGRYLTNDADRESYRAWVGKTVAPIAAEVGWEPKPGESSDYEGLRADLMIALGVTARDPQVQTLAHKLADEALADSSSVNHELGFAALRVAATSGDGALYDKIKNRLDTTKSPEQIVAYQQTLAQFGDPALLERTLEFAISPEVRSQDSPELIASVMDNPDGQKVAWDFVRAHWEKIRSIGGEFAALYIAGSVGNFCDVAMRNDVEQFFAAHHETASERTLKQSLERINYCVDLKTHQSDGLAAWLQHSAQSAQK